MPPEQLKYAKTHEWVAFADGVATIGISAFAVEALTDLVFIELPEVGRTVALDESFCEIESVKAVSDIYAPVAGEIVAVNDALPDALETLGDDPYEAGWIVKIKVADEAPLAELMDHPAYEKMCAEEAH
ncbi:MAG: glycine cleavage system protein GcvH [Planctomycetota bacterium]